LDHCPPHRKTDVLPDAVPKKRGPKTDVLEALLKRVDGLEKRLHTEGKSDDADDDDNNNNSNNNNNNNTEHSPTLDTTAAAAAAAESKSTTASQTLPQAHAARPSLEIAPGAANAASQLISPIEPRCL
jgi:hypothetical protein